MKIDVAISAGVVLPEQVKDKLVVVIDILRATSVICNGLQNGAVAFVPVEEVEEAFSLQQTYGYLCGGERHAEKIEGFQFGNSPLEYTPKLVKGKTIALTTSNGTRAIKNSLTANKLIIGAFANINRVVDFISSQENDVCLVCSGTSNQFSMDDSLCAGNIINDVLEKREAALSDAASAHLSLYNTSGADLHKALKTSCFHYNLLHSKGFIKDLDICLSKNSCNLLPYLKGSKLIL